MSLFVYTFLVLNENLWIKEKNNIKNKYFESDKFVQTLKDDGKTCDVDECYAGTSGCSDGCNNTIGSYQCTCPPEKFLSSDGHNCGLLKRNLTVMHGVYKTNYTNVF